MDRFQKLEQANRLLAIANELLLEYGENNLSDRVIDVIDEINNTMLDLEQESAVDN